MYFTNVSFDGRWRHKNLKFAAEIFQNAKWRGDRLHKAQAEECL